MVRPRNVNRYTAPVDVPDWEQEEFNSRTEIKLAAKAVTDLGERLVELSPKDFKSLNLPPVLVEAIETLHRIDKGPALKRQRLYIGKLLRQNEDIIVQVKEKFAEMDLKHKQQNAHFQRLEKWRDRLINDGDEALSELLSQYPQVDRQQMRQWIRNAQKEQAQEKPPKAAREMFQYLKALNW